ncbi:4Fe-4S single cluster domain-containing protein, partial [Streptococcus pyogenes]
SWNPRNGTPYTEETENELIKLLSNPHVDGLTLTGGDPFYRTNHPTLLKLLQRVRATLPDKDVWVWTGYTLEALQGDTER